MRELTALLAREWTQSRRWALAGTAMIALGYAFLFVMCRPEDRYRLLCDQALLRKVALTGPLLLGAALAYRGFAHEMRASTWDGLLMLPIARTKVLAAKLAFGVCVVVAASVGPMVALWALVSSVSVTGGPVLTLGELFAHSILGRSLLLGLAGYVAGASASTLLRGARALFWAPLLGPGFLYLAQSGDRSDERVSSGVVALSVALCALGAAHVAQEVRESGGAPSAWLRAWRGIAAVPLALVVIVFAVGTGIDLADRRAPEDFAPAPGAELGFTHDGHIARIAHGRSALSLYTMHARGASRRDRPARYWAPELVGSRAQYFLDKRAHVLLAYGLRSGVAMGCVGREGFRPRGCAPFETRPAFEQGNWPFVLLGSGVAVIDEQSASLAHVFRGPVTRVARFGDDETPLAVQSGGDLVLIVSREGEGDGAGEGERASGAGDDEAAAGDAADAEVLPPFGTRVACSGLGELGAVHSISVERDFVALTARRAGAAEQTLVVCRDGRITEQARVPAPRFAPVGASRRERVLAAVLGPVVSEVARGAQRERTFNDEPVPVAPPARGATWIVAAIAAGLCALAQAARDRRVSAATAATGVIALLVGPSFALAYALVHWKGRRWIRDAAG